MSDWFVYILSCSDDTLYTGVTTDTVRRVHQHNHTKAGAAYTRARRPVELAFELACESRSHALKTEYAIKQLTRAQKLDLIAGERDVPELES
jgi:putative endonuclease